MLEVYCCVRIGPRASLGITCRVGHHHGHTDLQSRADTSATDHPVSGPTYKRGLDGVEGGAR